MAREDERLLNAHARIAQPLVFGHKGCAIEVATEEVSGLLVRLGAGLVSVLLVLGLYQYIHLLPSERMVKAGPRARVKEMEKSR